MISRISYRWGMCASVDAADSLNHAEWAAPDIPRNVLHSLDQEHVLDYEGDSGDPSWGEPIEVDWVEIDVDGRIQSIRLFNRGIFLFNTDSEDVRRLHRFFQVLQGAAKRG